MNLMEQISHLESIKNVQNCTPKIKKNNKFFVRTNFHELNKKTILELLKVRKPIQNKKIS